MVRASPSDLTAAAPGSSGSTGPPATRSRWPRDPPPRVSRSYVAGVADAINHEVRLYLNGSLASVAGFTPAKGNAPDGVATVGGRLARTGLAERWTGQVGNPVLAQAALAGGVISSLSSESFFPNSNPDWDLNLQRPHRSAAVSPADPCGAGLRQPDQVSRAAVRPAAHACPR